MKTVIIWGLVIGLVLMTAAYCSLTYLGWQVESEVQTQDREQQTELQAIHNHFIPPNGEHINYVLTPDEMAYEASLQKILDETQSR